MRFLLALCVSGLVAGPLSAQDKKADNEPLEPAKLERTEAVIYEKEIQPIFKNRCIVCHSGPDRESQFDISSYETLIKGGKRGSPIVPGKSQDSFLFKVCSRTQKPFMPPKGELAMTPQELALILLWIDQGAKAPTGPTTVAKIGVGLLPANVTPVRGVAVSPDKSLIVMGRGNQIHYFDAAKGIYLRSLTSPDLTLQGKPVQAAHLATVESMAISPDGKYLVTGGFQEVAIWNVKSGDLEHRLTGFEHGVLALAFSADSKQLAAGGGVPTASGEIKVFEVGSWKLVADIKNGHSDTVFGVSFSPDGQVLASCSADKFIRFFELPGGKLVKSLEGHTHHVMDIGWKFDGKLLASAGADNTVRVWNYETGEQTKVIQGHTKQVTRLQFIGKTGTVATCGGDAQVKFWNADGGNVARNFPAAKDFLYAVSVSPDGQLVAAGGEEGIVYVYNGANGQLVRTLQAPRKE
jgi:WD40 repeat protein